MCRLAYPSGLAGRHLAHVQIGRHLQLLGQQVADGGDVLAEVGDDAHADLVGDLRRRVGVQPPAVHAAVALAANEATLLVRAVTLR